MNIDEIRFYEVEMTFLAPTGVTVPITAHSEDEAKEIALHLFKDHTNLSIVKVTDISTSENSQPAPMLN